jgi:ribosomal protein S18 acetylase RimI-like enzyme
MTNVIVRDYRSDDAGAVRACVVQLQEAERLVDPRLPAGEAMADAYVDHLHRWCERSSGTILVAEVDGNVAGFVAVMSREPFTEPDDPAGTYALVSDLAVLERFRRRGIGQALLDRALALADANGATEVRVAVLAGNDGARALYQAAGFAPYLETLARRTHR